VSECFFLLAYRLTWVVLDKGLLLLLLLLPVLLHIWRCSVVVIVVRRMNVVTLRRARLVLRWVTVFGRVYHHGT